MSDHSRYSLIPFKYYESRGINDSFSINHTTPYSAIGLQELNLAYHYPIIYWNTACLIVNAGADEEAEKTKTTNYGKVASAIANMKAKGIEVSLPLINSAKFEFVPDEKNNRIIYSFKSLCNVGDEVAKMIIENQPYDSFEDFCVRMIDTKLIKPSTMIILIKAGAFTELDNEDRRKTMDKFIRRNLFSPCNKLTMQQYKRMKEENFIPDELKLVVRIKDFKDYVLHDFFFKENVIDKSKKKIPKCGYHDRHFILDDTSMPFFKDNFSEDSIVGVCGEYYIISEKKFIKEWEKLIQPLKDWFDKEDTLKKYNDMLFTQCQGKNASGSIPKWEMDSLSFYYTEHELKNLDEDLYGVVNFFEQPEEPEIYDTYTRYIKGEKREFSKFRIDRLAGTVLDKDNSKHTITLLTQYGVVNVKFGKGQYGFYSKRISHEGKIVEDSWFKRGTKVMVCGYRRDSQFFAYKYADTIYNHTCMKIEELYEDGTALLKTERTRIN